MGWVNGGQRNSNEYSGDTFLPYQGAYSTSQDDSFDVPLLIDDVASMLRREGPFGGFWPKWPKSYDDLIKLPEYSEDRHDYQI